MTSTLYARAASPSAVERAAAREPNNEKITLEHPVNEQPNLSPSPDDLTSLPGSLGNLAQELRNVIGILSESEMAAILQVSHETLATWRTKRRGPPHVKIGKRAFYMRGDFSQWVMGEVERQAAINAPKQKQQRKRQHKPETQTKDKREDHVTEVGAQDVLPIV
jgi:hypothetical protein